AAPRSGAALSAPRAVSFPRGWPWPEPIPCNGALDTHTIPIRPCALVACGFPARGYFRRRNLRSRTMKMGGDSVDVVIAAWNSERTIGRAVRSALLQRRVARVIVVDDASTD